MPCQLENISLVGVLRFDSGSEGRSLSFRHSLLLTALPRVDPGLQCTIRGFYFDGLTKTESFLRYAFISSGVFWHWSSYSKPLHFSLTLKTGYMFLISSR